MAGFLGKYETSTGELNAIRYSSLMHLGKDIRQSVFEQPIVIESIKSIINFKTRNAAKNLISHLRFF